MSISLSLTLFADENAKSKLQMLASGVFDERNFLKLWKSTETVMQDPPAGDALTQSVATFRDGILALDKNGQVQISDLKNLLEKLKSSPHPDVADYWRNFQVPTSGKFIKVADISEAVREFLLSNVSGGDCSTSEFSGTSEHGANRAVLPLLVEIRNDVKAVKENSMSRPVRGCSDAFASLNSCFMQSSCFVVNSLSDPSAWT